MDLPVSDRGDFSCRRAVDSFKFVCIHILTVWFDITMWAFFFQEVAVPGTYMIVE